VFNNIYVTYSVTAGMGSLWL